VVLRALIVAQLEADGILRTLRMQPSTNGDIAVAFAGEYDERRDGPFHFLDEEDERRFREGFAGCRIRRLSDKNFVQNGSSFHVKTSWRGVPTDRNGLSYYALSLPEFGILERLSIADPHKAGREYRRFVTRDDERCRWIIYLECISSLGRFDFDLSCTFRIDEHSFASSRYHDPMLAESGRNGDDWKELLSESERVKVQQFFIGSIRMGDNYSAWQAGAMGPNAQATGNTFQQIGKQSQGSVDLRALADELHLLQLAMRSEESAPTHHEAIEEVATAQKAAIEGEAAKVLEHLRNAGKWALDVSTKIGVGVAEAMLKTALGL